MTTRIPDHLPATSIPSTPTTTPTTTTRTTGASAKPSAGSTPAATPTPNLPPKPTKTTASTENAGRRATLDSIASASGSGSHRVSTYDTLRSQMEDPSGVPPWLATILKKSCDPACTENAKKLGQGINTAFTTGMSSPASARELEVRTSIANASPERASTAASTLNDFLGSWAGELGIE